MRVKIISESTLQDLRVNYDSYKEHYYKRDTKWFDDYFSGEGKAIETTIDMEMPTFNLNPDFSLSDQENVKIIYTALRHLTVVQATEERLWSGLAHLQLREYAYYRLEKELNEKNDNRINTALFFKNGNKRSLFVHILARLWWVGYMTYDEENVENPFWLTEFFCEKDFSARCVVFFSSNFTSNKEITIGILKALYKIKESGVPIIRDHFVQSTKYLNVVGGAMVLDMLTSEEVEEMVAKHLNKLFNFDSVRSYKVTN